jgi:Xylanase inhibitor N-terminal
MRQLQLIVLSFLFFLHPSLSSSLPQSQSVHFKLHRRTPVRLHHPSHLKPLFLSDLQRQHWIRSTIKRNLASSENYHPTCQSSSQAFEMPIGSGAYTGIGQYFVRVRVGTPAKPFLLVADTGSDLTWVKCQQHNYGTKEEKDSGARARIFRPEQSSSWQPIECSTDLCQKTLPFALATCPAPDSPCLYDYRYAYIYNILSLFLCINAKK